MLSHEAFVGAYHAHFTRTPNQRQRLGIAQDIGRMGSPDDADRLETVREAKSLLGEVEALESAAIDFDTRLDLELARLALANEIHLLTVEIDGVPEQNRKPRVGDAVGDPLVDLMVLDPRPAHERLADVVGRLEDVPSYAAGKLRTYDRPIERWRDIDREICSGLPELFGHLLAWAEGEAFPGFARLERAIAGARDALETYDRGLAAMETSRQLHLAPGDGEQIIANRGIALTPNELHAIATRFLRENREQIAELASRLRPKYGLAADASSAELSAELKRRHPALEPGEPADHVLDRYRDASKEIERFVEERDLFPIPASQAIRILRTPSFAVPMIPAGAMISPAPFREGMRTSIVYLTLEDGRVGEHTKLDIPMMMVHEGIPGHHLQLATASMHRSTIRRHADFMDHGEGWTTMLEDYMLDVGFHAQEVDEMRFVAKRDIARIGARVAIDLFFMTGERDFLDVGVDADISNPDPFLAAGSLLAAVTDFSPGRIKAELNFYSLERGYPLSYLTGNHLVWELKRDLANAQRGKLEGLALDRVFHRTYLESGNMPVRLLRRVFEHQGLLPAAA
jgi:hypothetical protein